jgi:uncharacterized protein YaaR (DUF327 family)
MASGSPNYLRAAFTMPANVFALVAGGVASVMLQDPVPLAAAGGASILYLSLLSVLPSFRRAVRANLAAQGGDEVATPDEVKRLVAELAPSQREHYLALVELKARILEAYQRLPGGGVLAASSERRLDTLLTSFLRLVGSLNASRRYLGGGERAVVEQELAALVSEVESEGNQRLKEVKLRRVGLLKKRLERFVQAAESRELVSHQLASIEDILRLTHEQSIAVTSPEAVSRQLEALTAEADATEETVREMEQFMSISDELGEGGRAAQRERVR